MTDVNAYLQLARTLDRKAFIERHGHPVLIRRSDEQSLDPRAEYSSTLRMKIDRRTRLVRVEPNPPSPFDPVVPLRKSDRNSFASKILVGRTETNDVIVIHLTVSKHHAYFTNPVEAEPIQLIDTDSTNGTQVNGQALAPRQPMLLVDGDQIDFGDARFTFYTANGFFDVLLSLPAMR